MVAADDSYCTIVLMPRDCHLSKLPLGCDHAPMTKTGGVAASLGWLVMRAKSFLDPSTVDWALSWKERTRRRATPNCTRIGMACPGASAPVVQPPPVTAAVPSSPPTAASTSWTTYPRPAAGPVTVNESVDVLSFWMRT